MKIKAKIYFTRKAEARDKDSKPLAGDRKAIQTVISCLDGTRHGLDPAPALALYADAQGIQVVTCCSGRFHINHGDLPDPFAIEHAGEDPAGFISEALEVLQRMAP
jgi:hypothetical protein